MWFLAGRVRNIYFIFDIDTDTALSVATEMVAELDINDQDVTEIADMIDEEISSLVPEWLPGPRIEEMPQFTNVGFCHNCVSSHTSTGSLMETLSHNLRLKNLHVQCLGCASMHGRFEEISYQFEESNHQGTEDGRTDSRSQLHYQEIWDQHESHELSSVSSDLSCTHTEEGCKKLDESVIRPKTEADSNLEKQIQSLARGCSTIRLTGLVST